MFSKKRLPPLFSVTVVGFFLGKHRLGKRWRAREQGAEWQGVGDEFVHGRGGRKGLVPHMEGCRWLGTVHVNGGLVQVTEANGVVGRGWDYGCGFGVCWMKETVLPRRRLLVVITTRRLA